MLNFRILFGARYANEVHPIKIGGVRVHPQGWFRLEACDGLHANMAAQRLFGDRFALVRGPFAEHSDDEHYPLGELASLVAPAQSLLNLMPLRGARLQGLSKRVVQTLWIPADLAHPIAKYVEPSREDAGDTQRLPWEGLLFHTDPELDPATTSPNHRANAILASLGAGDHLPLLGDVVVTIAPGFHGYLIGELIVVDEGDPVWALQLGELS